MKVLIKNRARTDTEDRHKRTPLFHAYTSRDLRLIQLLLDQGANVNHKNGKGQKILEIALKEGYLDIAALLLRYGAHVGKSVINIAESSLGAFLCVVGHLEQRGNIMIKVFIDIIFRVISITIMLVLMSMAPLYVPSFT